MSKILKRNIYTHVLRFVVFYVGRWTAVTSFVDIVLNVNI